MSATFGALAMETPTIILSYAAAFFFVLVAIAAAYALFKAGATLGRVDSVLDDVDKQAVPLMQKAGTTLDGVNANLGNVDQITQDVAEITDAGVCHGDVLYIPAGETSGEPVRQASSFIDENDQFLASDLDADRDALADLICRLRSVDPVQTLDSLLQSLRLGKYPLLHGKTFQLTVGVGLAPGHTVDLVDHAAAGGGAHAGR